MEDLRSARAPVRFGPFELDRDAEELRKNGIKIRLQEQPLQILEILLQHPGKVIAREELREKTWPSDTFVDFDHGINNAIKRLREALGDNTETPRYIETLPRRGYRFIGKIEREAPRFRSLAVLPLENLSRDPEQEYFAEGLTEALITTLAKIGELRVVSRTSAMVYKDARKPLREIARELEVDVIVEGTVLRAGDRVRITAQLIDPEKETHLWAESYQRHLRDVLDLHAELAQSIARQVQVKLTPQEQAQLAQSRPVNPEAYEAYLKGRYHWNRRSRDGLPKGVQYFQEAIAKDAGYAAAYAGLADCLSGLSNYNFVAPDEGCGKARKLALQALELDPGFAPAHAVHCWAALSKLMPEIAISAAQNALRCSPGAVMYLASLGECYAALGNRQEAQKMLDHLHDLSKQQYVTPYFLARIYAALGRKEEALHSLEAGYVERTSSLVFMKVDARLDELRTEPRFHDLMRRMNFPD